MQERLGFVVCLFNGIAILLPPLYDCNDFVIRIYDSIMICIAIKLYIAVLGCADMEPVAGSRLRRQDDKVTVECVESGRQWELVCQNNEWIGAKADCDKGKIEALYRLFTT